MNLASIDGNRLVALFQSGLGGRHALVQVVDEESPGRSDPDDTDFLVAENRRMDFCLHPLIFTKNGERYQSLSRIRSPRAGHDAVLDIHEVHDLIPIHGEDLVSGENTCCLGRARDLLVLLKERVPSLYGIRDVPDPSGQFGIVAVVSE